MLVVPTLLAQKKMNLWVWDKIIASDRSAAAYPVTR
jgi:hypothetical protein